MMQKQLERVLREGLTIHVEKIIEKEGFTKRIIIANQFDESWFQVHWHNKKICFSPVYTNIGKKQTQQKIRLKDKEEREGLLIASFYKTERQMFEVFPEIVEDFSKEGFKIRPMLFLSDNEHAKSGHFPICIFGYHINDSFLDYWRQNLKLGFDIFNTKLACAFDAKTKYDSIENPGKYHKTLEIKADHIIHLLKNSRSIGLMYDGEKWHSKPHASTFFYQALKPREFI